MEVKFKIRYRDYNKGDVIELVEVAAQYKVGEQRMLTRLLGLKAIEFPGQARLKKPTPEDIARKVKAKEALSKKLKAARAKAAKARAEKAEAEKSLEE